MDFEGDTCDLDDGLILVELLAPTDVRYQEEQGFSTFNIYRGNLGVLRNAHVYTQDPFLVPAATPYCGETGGSVYDAETPVANGILFYLVTGISAAGESTLGTDSAGNLRPNDNPCP